MAQVRGRQIAGGLTASHDLNKARSSLRMGALFCVRDSRRDLHRTHVIRTLVYQLFFRAPIAGM
jgi:hypothetical protein